MKEVLAKDLKVGDIFYYKDRYWEVISILITVVRVKCIMSPTSWVIDIGDYNYIPKLSRVKVILLCRDGVEV